MGEGVCSEASGNSQEIAREEMQLLETLFRMAGIIIGVSVGLPSLDEHWIILFMALDPTPGRY